MAEVEAAESPLLALKIQRLIDLLQESAGFLLDPNAQQQLADMDKEDARVARADIMLEALGVESRAELETLVSYFYTSIGARHRPACSPVPGLAADARSRAGCRGGGRGRRRSGRVGGPEPACGAAGRGGRGAAVCGGQGPGTCRGLGGSRAHQVPTE